MSEQRRRIGTAVVAAPAFLGVTYVGGWLFAGLIAAIGVAAQWEMYSMARSAGLRPLRVVGAALGAGLVLAMQAPVLGPVVLAAGVLLLPLSPWLVPRERFLDNLAVTVWGVVYPTGLLGTLVALRTARGPAVDGGDAFWLVVLTLFLVWATDIFAYYTGKSLGRRPLAPTISPNKTWEGTAGGAGAALLVAIGFKLVVLNGLSWVDVVVLAAIGGGLSQAGDLVESQMKRATGTKDAGSLLPGHGGMLDRFDSMVVAAPLVYLYLRHVSGLL